MITQFADSLYCLNHSKKEKKREILKLLITLTQSLPANYRYINKLLNLLQNNLLDENIEMVTEMNEIIGK